MGWYWLDDDNKPEPVPDNVGSPEFANYCEWLSQNKIVKQSDVGIYWVSTVFLGLDHQFSEGETPILWETMVTKKGEWLYYQRRYMCYQDAVNGHAAVCSLLSNPFTVDQIDEPM